jgi:hypothetical protein
MGAENPVTSGDLHILVYETAEPISSQGPDYCTGAWESATDGWPLMERSVRAVRVVMHEVLLQHRGEVMRPGDQEVVEAFASQVPMKRTAIPFARDARTGVRMMRMSGAGEHGVEGGGELAVSVADQEPALVDSVAE